jgi:hypothetical protein
MNRKWLIISIPLLFSFSFAYVPPRVYLIYPAHGQELSSNARIEAEIAPSAHDLKPYITAQAQAYGVNPTLALWIVSHESQFDPTRKGDDGQSRGLWQISSIYHPEVTDACAFDIQCSTAWSLNWIVKGNVMQWSTRRFCSEWYPDCPF